MGYRERTTELGLCALLSAYAFCVSIYSAYADAPSLVESPKIDIKEMLAETNSGITNNTQLLETFDVDGKVTQVSILERDFKNQLLEYTMCLGSVDTISLIKNIDSLSDLGSRMTWIYQKGQVYQKAGPGGLWQSRNDVETLKNVLLPFLGAGNLRDNGLYQGLKRTFNNQLNFLAESGDSQRMAETLAALKNMNPANHPDGNITVTIGSFVYKFVVDKNEDIQSIEVIQGRASHTKITNINRSRNLEEIWQSALSTQKIFNATGSLEDAYNSNFSGQTLVLGLGMDKVNNSIIATKLLPKGPASLAGIEQGNEIITINDIDVSTLTGSELINLVAKGQSVTVVFKDKDKNIKNVTIKKVPLNQIEQGSGN